MKFRAVLQNQPLISFKRGQIIFQQNELSQGIFYLDQGKIKLSRIGQDGKESILLIAAPGDILGHRNLISDDNYGATAVALEESKLRFLSKQQVREAIQQEPEIAFSIIRKLTQEVYAAETRNSSLYQKSVRQRLAELLIQLKTSFGVEEQGKLKLDIRLTREEMACLIGTTNETVIRTISDFKEEGIIRQIGKTIYLENEEKLLAALK